MAKTKEHPFDKYEPGTTIGYMEPDEVALCNKMLHVDDKIKKIVEATEKRRNVIWAHLTLKFSKPTIDGMCVVDGKIYGGSEEDTRKENLDKLTLLGDLPSEYKVFFTRGKRIRRLLTHESHKKEQYRILMWDKIEKRLGYNGQMHYDRATTQIKSGSHIAVPGALQELLREHMPEALRGLLDGIAGINTPNMPRLEPPEVPDEDQ